MSLCKITFMGTDNKACIPEMLRLVYDRASLAKISAALKGIQGRLGLSDAGCRGLRLALEELVTNSIMHGRPVAEHVDPDTGIHVDFQVDGEFLYFRYVDHGAPFDPRKDLPRDAREDNLDDRPDGQLGWPLILHYCELVEYRREDGRNCMLFMLRERVSIPQ